MGRSAVGVVPAVLVSGLGITNAVRFGPTSAATGLLSRPAVFFGFGVVAQVFVYPGSQPVRFRVVVREQLDVPVDVG